MRQREPAICLRATDYSETSQVLHFLTRGQGAVRLLGKGTKRPRSKSGGAVDLLSEGQLVYTVRAARGLGTLIEFTETVSHAQLRRKAAHLNAGLYMLEVVSAMIAEGDPHAKVFDLLHNALARLEQADAPVQAVLAYFQWRLLHHVGLLGRLNGCVSCGRPVRPGDRDTQDRQVFFCSAQGGLVCGDCRLTVPEKLAVGPDTLAALAALAAAETGRRAALPEQRARSVNGMLAYHVAVQIGRWPRTARYAIGPEARGQPGS